MSFAMFENPVTGESQFYFMIVEWYNLFTLEMEHLHFMFLINVWFFYIVDTEQSTHHTHACLMFGKKIKHLPSILNHGHTQMNRETRGPNCIAGCLS